MKNLLLTILIIFFFIGPAQGQPFGMGHSDGHFERPETGPTATPREKLIGHCTITPGPSNLMPQPCGSLLITLTSKDSGETLNTRTTTDGAFEFTIPVNKAYTIGVKSRFYEVVDPLTDLKRGQEINLKLRQK